MSDFIAQALGLIQAHAWAGLGGLIMMTFVTILTDRAHFAPTWNSPWRPFLGTVFGAIGLCLSRVQGGSAAISVILDIGAATLPTLITEFMLIKKGGAGGLPTVVSAATKSMRPPPPYSTMKLVGIALACSAISGCAAFGKTIVPILDNAQTVIVDGQMILDAIQAAETVFFLSAPNPDLQTKVTRALGDARLALDSALRATKGGKDLSDHDYDAAFDEFRSAYKELVAVLFDAGVAAPAALGKLAIRRGAEIAVLEPLAMAPVLK